VPIEWLYLSIAILSEVAGSTALKAANGFRSLWPSLIVVLGYGSAFYFLSLTLEAIPLGVAYAVWSGVGVALISLAGWAFYRQSLGVGELAGIGLIVAGVVVLNVFGKGAG
jgi:small multidrug resistance pump